jgi:MSHA biogenesis protein MshJ
MEQLRQFGEILDRRSLRERIFILLALVAALVFGWNQLFFESSRVARKKALNEIEQVGSEIVLLQAEEQAFLRAAKQDPDTELRQQIVQLEQASSDLDRQFEAKLGDLLSPRQMPVLLQQLLKKQRSLQLLKMENLPPEPMMRSSDKGEAKPVGIYIHALNMELEGSYLKLLNYLQALEQLEQRVFWDILTIDTKEFPVARISLRIHTLSLKEAWIGV